MMTLPKAFLKLLERKDKEVSIAFPAGPDLVPPIGSPMIFDGKRVGEIIKVDKVKSILTATIKDKKVYEKYLKPKELPISMGCRIIGEEN